MHLCSIDSVYQELVEENFDITEYDAESASRNVIFSINDFMKDLEKLCTTTPFNEALEAIGVTVEDATLPIIYFIQRR